MRAQALPRVARLALVLATFACSSPPPAAPTSDAGHPTDGMLGDSGPPRDAALSDTRRSPADSSAPGDGGTEATVDSGAPCSIDGNLGTCIAVTACATKSGYQSTAGYCPGAADIECCAPIPDVADNPPTPAGYMLMAQSAVTPAMTAWAVMILDDPTDYPMFSTATKTFGTLMVLARVEWHPPDVNNEAVHRGVTLYQPI